jgi:hypothetical protein
MSDQNGDETVGSPPGAVGGLPITLGVGQIQFYDSYLPPLEAGKYTLTLTQTVATTGETTVYQTFEQTQYIHVAGPRFALDPTDVYSVYPGANAQQVSPWVLPNVLLSRPTLPWERLPVDASSPPDGAPESPPGGGQTPWLALLVFSEEDFPLGAADPAFQALASATPTTATGVIARASGVVVPAIQLTPLETSTDAPCNVIEVDADLFKAIAPNVTDVALLAHVRQVNTDHKQSSLPSGWFSVIVANRLPQPGARSIVHLVSLEGLLACLPGGASPPVSGQRVRLITMTSWAFTAGSAHAGFAEMFSALGPALPLCVPAPTPASPPAEASTPAGAIAAEAIADNGYVALGEVTREGEQTTGWYRGPLTPVPIPVPPEEPAPLPCSDAALIFDPASGLFDVSYAAAWELGRLLALASPSFSAALLAWRTSAQKALSLLAQRRALAERYGDTLTFPADSASLVRPKLMRSLVRSFLTGPFAARFAHVDAREAAPVARRDPLGIARRREGSLPGLLEGDALDAVFAQPADPTHTLIERALGHTAKGRTR